VVLEGSCLHKKEQELEQTQGKGTGRSAGFAGSDCASALCGRYGPTGCMAVLWALPHEGQILRYAGILQME